MCRRHQNLNSINSMPFNSIRFNTESFRPQFATLAPRNSVVVLVPMFTIPHHLVWILILLQTLVYSVGCPTSGQFKSLQNSVIRLENIVKQLTEKLFETELRLQNVEECDCFKSCLVNGSIHAEGSSWKQDCDICSCVRGEVICRPIHCQIPCKNPEMIPNECCPVCKKTCYLNGRVLQHGERIKIPTKPLKSSKHGNDFNGGKCGECVCNDGKTTCRQIVIETMCPTLDCPFEQQFTREDRCCKFCAGSDFCSAGNDCHPNATCHNMNADYTCLCNEGFSGDGKVCQDINECNHKGGPDGHHCGKNTICVNTLGSYKCECFEGHKRQDSYQCIGTEENGRT